MYVCMYGPWPKTIAGTGHFHCARAIFRSGPNNWFLEPPENRFKAFWPLAQNHCQNGSFSLRASHFSVWTEYLVFGTSRRPFEGISGPRPKTIARTVHFHCARTIFRSGQNILFLEPPEGGFKAFLGPGPKPLPERFIFIAREVFFVLDRISGFWNLQMPF